MHKLTLASREDPTLQRSIAGFAGESVTLETQLNALHVTHVCIDSCCERYLSRARPEIDK